MIVRQDIYMETLGRKRRMMIYLPDDYQVSGKRYPVMVINDGQNAFFDEESYMHKSWGFYDYALEHHLDVIMVAIDCNFEDYKREDEYGPWKLSQQHSLEEGANRIIGGEGKKYCRFLVKELKPFLDRTYPTDSHDYAIVGSSMGGLISFYAFLKYPRIFKKCAILSTAFWFYQDKFLRMIKRSSIKNNMLYMDVGGREDPRYVPCHKEIDRALQGKINNYMFQYFEDHEHNEYYWSQRIHYFLDWFYNSGK